MSSTKGKILKMETFSQLTIPTFYPPEGAEVLCLKEHGFATGDRWFDVLYEDKIYTVGDCMIKHHDIERLKEGSIVILHSGEQAVITRVIKTPGLGTFFTILVSERVIEISSISIKEIIDVVTLKNKK